MISRCRLAGPRRFWFQRGVQPLLGLTSDALADQVRGMPGGGLSHRLYREAMHEGRFDPEGAGLGPRAVEAWRARHGLDLLEVVRTQDEAAPDGRMTTKAVMRTPDDYEVECVRIPMARDRWTLCVSSQVGCRLGCVFCETGKIGLVRHLSAAEIVAQVVTAKVRLGWPVQKIVFMGMGEPLDNAEAVVQALRVFHDPRGFALGQAQLTICTAGHVEGLKKLAELHWSRLNLSVSLNAAFDAKRDKLMPINRRVPLAELQDALVRFRPSARFIFAINYCLLPGFNDAAEDVAAVADFCRPLGRCLVNVIPYNPGSKPLTRRPSEVEVDDFVAALKEAGLPVQRRRTKGQGVMAACGQLGNLELRAHRQRLPVYEP